MTLHFLNNIVDDAESTQKAVAVQWLNGRVLDLRLRDCWLEHYQRHCVVSFSKSHTSLLSAGSTQEEP